MKRCKSLFILCFALCISLTSPAGSVEAAQKMRILVDKTFMHFQDEIITRDQVQEVAESGFTVFVPRRGGSDLEFLRKVAGWAQEDGLSFMPWMRGTYPAGDGPRMVWADGTVTPICSPTSDRFWNWTEKYITAYARLSTEIPSVIGVFLDYEIYAHPKKGNAYALSYDLPILRAFAAEEGIDLPELAPEERAKWLRKQGLHERFADFQVARWRARCRELRKEVDRINPEFRFCVYPAPGTRFIQEAIYPEWATEKAPLILADASTYGRRAAIPHKQALQANRTIYRKRMKAVENYGIPFDYVGGLDPVVEGADPEFCGKSAVMISDVSDGYWVFYEGPMRESLQDTRSYFTPGPADHEAYWHWFTWANTNIARGNFDAQNEPRETPDTVGPTVGPPLEPVYPEGAPQTEDLLKRRPTRLRGWGCYYVKAKKGQSINLRMRGEQLGDYQDVPVYKLVGPDEKELRSGELPLHKVTSTSVEAQKSGTYTLFIYSRSNAFSTAIGAPHQVIASREYPAGTGPVHICGFARRLYFYVPSETERFAIHLRSPHGPAERIAAKVLDPEGETVAQKETTEASLSIAVPEKHRGKPWSIVFERPEKGVFEDAFVRLEGVPPLFSESPRALLIPAK